MAPKTANNIGLTVYILKAKCGLSNSKLQPHWITIPKDKEFGCLNKTSNEIDKIRTTDKGSCGISGMCYPLSHEQKVSGQLQAS